MAAWIAPAIAGISSVLNGLFGFKGKQTEVASKALETFDAISDSDKAYFAASASAIESVYAQGSWIEKNWRPTFMWVCIGLVIARWCGWTPPGLSPEEITHMYTFIYIGLGGYMPLRSIDKWMQGFQIGAILKDIIRKKLV